MLHPNALQKLFQYNHTLIHKQSALITHAESVIPLPASGQCYNWLLGHIISARTFALHYLKQSPVWTDAQRKRYRNGSLGAFSPTDPAPFTLATLIATFDITQTRIEAGLRNTTYEKLCQPSGYQTNTVGDSLAYFHFHETHHIGQLMYLAQNVGKSGVWI